MSVRKLCIFAIFLTLQIILTRPVSYLRKSDNQRTQNWDDIYISYWHESNLIGKCKTQTSRIIVVIVFKRSDFKKSKGFLRGFASQVPILCNRIKLIVSKSNVSPSWEENPLLLQNMTKQQFCIIYKKPSVQKILLDISYRDLIYSHNIVSSNTFWIE